MVQLSPAATGRHQSRARLTAWLAVGAIAAVLAAVRWQFPERPLEAASPRALLDAGFALGLAALTLIVSLGLGRCALSWLRLEDLTRLERLVFSLLVGLGMTAYGVLALGLLGLLERRWILIWLALAGLAGAGEWGRALTRAPALARTLPAQWRGLHLGQKLLLIIGGLLLTLSLLQALTPPWDYDGLMYHLQGPRLFLEAGRIVLLPDVWQANGPFTIEMLYTLGLSVGSGTFAKLIHLTYALLLCLATYALGKRTLGATAGWIAAAVLVGIPLFPLWASFAYADMAWTAYELLALMALLRWRESQQSRWIVAAGLGTGLALGSKYLALGGAAVFGLWLLWHSRARGPRAVLVNAALFGGIALAIASPWYLKNWALGGNPVYPAYFGGLGWTEERLTYYTQYHDSFGVGHRLIDYLLLPWNLYAHHERFGTFQGSAEIPSLLFPIALFWPFIRRPAAIKGLGFIALGRFVFWALGSQQTRFLLPLFPILGLMVAAVLLDVGRRPWGRLLGRVLPAGLAGGMLFATLLYSIIFCTQMWPIPVIVGAESADAYLRRIASDYPGIRFVMTELPEDARVLMMWDGQGYYCDSRCWPDPENSRWTRYVQAAESTGALADRLRGEGVTHLFFSRGDIGFMALHDPSGQHVAALRFFWSEFSGRHTRRVFSDEWVGVYELVSR